MSDHSDSKKSQKINKSNIPAPDLVLLEASNSRVPNEDVEHIPHKPPGPRCPLLAKDSEWVDILQTPAPSVRDTSNPHGSDEEEVLQLVECEESPQMRPLAVMFPDLLDKDPRTLQGMLNKTMSTTEVTRTLVDLGQKANFTFMKKNNRLIPPGKKWLESLTESISYCSVMSDFLSRSLTSDCDDSLKDLSNSQDPSIQITISDQNSVAQVLTEMLQQICGTDPNQINDITNT